MSTTPPLGVPLARPLPGLTVRPPGRVCLAAVVSLAVLWTAVRVGAAVARLVSLRAIERWVVDGGGEPMVAVTTVDSWVPAAVEACLLVAVWACTSAWLARSRRVCDAMAPTAHSLSRRWAWWAWVTPVVCWWFPFRYVRDVLRAVGERPRRLLAWWWAAWLVVVVVDTAGLWLVDEQPTVESLVLAARLDLVAGLALAVALVPWLVLVRRVASGTGRLAAARLAGPVR